MGTVNDVVSILGCLPYSLLVVVSPLYGSVVYLSVFGPVPLLLAPRVSGMGSSVLLVFFDFSESIPAPLSYAMVLGLSSR